MRMTTARAPRSSNALRSAAIRLSALASASVAMAPRTSTSAVCAVTGALAEGTVWIVPQMMEAATKSQTMRQNQRQRCSLRCWRR